jgi:hypothetical protein
MIFRIAASVCVKFDAAARKTRKPPKRNRGPGRGAAVFVETWVLTSQDGGWQIEAFPDSPEHASCGEAAVPDAAVPARFLSAR